MRKVSAEWPHGNQETVDSIRRRFSMVKRVTLWLVGALAVTAIFLFLIYPLIVKKMCLEPNLVNEDQGTGVAQADVSNPASCN